MSDDTQHKKKFNPFLAPTETEEEPKLVEEEEDKKPVQESESDEAYDTDEETGAALGDEGGFIEEEIPEEMLVEEDVDEMRRHESEREPRYQEKHAARRSWSVYALGIGLCLLAGDVFVRLLGGYFFWTPQTVYFVSLGIRTALLIITAFMLFRSVFQSEADTVRIVYAWIGGSTGVVLASMRFADDPSFWSFINMFVEPVDGVLLGFGIAYVASVMAVAKQHVPAH